MKIAVVSSSLRPGSYSKIMARRAHEVLTGQGHAPGWIDLVDLRLPMCDGDAAYETPEVERATEELKGYDRVIAATAVYNYDANAALKNYIELTGSAWENKIVGFLCAAGGTSSYMSIMSLANSLMLDFRCWIVPRFVYAEGDDFAKGAVKSAQIQKRIAGLCADIVSVRIGTA